VYELYRLFSTILFPENFAVYGLIWKNIVEPDRAQTLYAG
jgi:hypothetical protein